MADELAKTDDMLEGLKQFIVKGDISLIPPAERGTFLWKLAEHHGLDPTTQPFQIITTAQGQKLYAAKACSDQLRKKYGISIEVLSTSFVNVEGGAQNTWLLCHVRATLPDGRVDEDYGMVNFTADPINAHKKAITQAKRRVTLSISGLGMTDESELSDITYKGEKGTVRVFSAPTIPESQDVVDATIVQEAPPEPATATNGNGKAPQPTSKPIVAPVTVQATRIAPPQVLQGGRIPATKMPAVVPVGRK